MWLDRIPASVAFCDVETTGLGKDDRIVSFGGIGMITKDFAKGRSQLTYTYLVFDPGKRNHPGAQQVHGFSDWVLAAQEPFEVHAAQVWRFLTSYDLLVAHNAAFDFRFINREMTSAGLSTLTRPIFCTLKAYRELGRGGSAALSAVCSHLKLARSGANCTQRLKMLGSPCRFTFGCTAVLSSADYQFRYLELRPTSVTWKLAGSVFH